MNQNKVLSVRNLVLIAMFSALAAVLETIQVAVPFAPPFYKLDFAELPVLIGGFAMGPAQAALIAIVKNLLKLLLNGTALTMSASSETSLEAACSPYRLP